MPALWRYLREREILPYFEMMTPQGRMLENRHLMVEPARLRQVFEEIAAIDAQFGFCWSRSRRWSAGSVSAIFIRVW